jgi:hypothetical protein
MTPTSPRRTLTPPKAILALLLIPVAARSQTPTNTEHQVLALVQRFTNAEIRFDPATLRDVTADDYVEVSAVGEVTARDKWLSSYNPAGNLAVMSLTLSDPQVRLFGPNTAPDTAIVIERLTFLMPAPGNTTRTAEMRGTFVARKFPAGWKLVSTQFTGLPNPSPSATP